MSSTLSANDYSTEPFDKWGNFYGFRTENGPDALSVSPETEKVFFKDPRNNYLLKGFTESGDIDGKKIKGKISNFIKYLTGPEISRFNRYRRGLEICPQAKTFKSGREYFLLLFPTPSSDEYDSAPRRKYSFERFRLYRL